MSRVTGSRTLHRLIYASRPANDEAAGEDQVAEIIRASIRNNRAAAITGLLLVHDGWFVQALEGPHQAVMTTYGRILKDARHRDATVIAAGSTYERGFADWNMCARRLTAADDAILDTLALRQHFEPPALDGAKVLRLLTAVRGIQERTQLRALT